MYISLLTLFKFSRQKDRTAEVGVNELRVEYSIFVRVGVMLLLNGCVDCRVL
jgi:hypothetical protein